MKKLLLACLAVSIPALSLAEELVEVPAYKGRSLSAFQAEDAQLKQAMNQSMWDIRAIFYTSWFMRPSAERLARMNNHITILKERLPLIENTITKAEDALKQVRRSLELQGPGAFAAAIILFPWVLISEWEYEKKRAPYIRAIKNVEQAKTKVEERIKKLEQIVSKYSAQ